LAFVRVASGTFALGSERGEADERTRAPYVASRDFLISAYEVTWEQYLAYCAASGATSPPPPDHDASASHPVVNVTYEEAEAFAAFYGLALPTEAQWEAAARGGEARSFPWGEAFSCEAAAHRGPSDAARCGCGRPSGPAPVGSHPAGASPFGAQDMAGNVWEWCRSLEAQPSADDVWVTRPSQAAGRAPVRGGAWNALPERLRASNRAMMARNTRADVVGFRVVAPATPEE
jgi:iron(II)-dependent oxidoreductase